MADLEHGAEVSERKKRNLKGENQCPFVHIHPKLALAFELLSFVQILKKK